MRGGRIFLLARVVAAGMLLLALTRQPYSYYTALRIVVCWVAGYGTFLALRTQRTRWAGTFGTEAVVFNPIWPIHLDRATWAVVDVAAAMVLLLSIPFLASDDAGSES